jgi:hypothetical protein
MCQGWELKMPITTGEYAPRTIMSRRELLAHRWFWLRHNVALLMQRPWRLDESDTGVGHALYREWGYWTVRPVAGWRSRRWITPPMHATRCIPGADHDAAIEWSMERLGIE